MKRGWQFNISASVKYIIVFSCLILVATAGLNCNEKLKEVCCCTMPFKADGSTHTYYAFTDLDSAAVCAKKRKQNILVIFTGYTCSAIPRKEWQILDLLDDEKLIKDNFVIAVLYVDDREKLKDTTLTTEVNGEIWNISTIGRKYLAMQISLFQNNAHPLFCFMDSNLRPLGKIMGYTKDKKEVDAFIASGLEKQ